MARPAKFDRQQAVDIVMNEIWKNGFELSSVNALSNRLGITRSSFYNAFGTREELFAEVLKRYFEQAPDHPLGDAGPTTPIKPLMTSVFRAICRARAMDLEGRGCMAVNGVAELCPAHQEVGSLIAQAVIGSLGRIEKLIGWAIASGELPAETNARRLALAVQNLLIGLNVMSKVVRAEDELWAAAATTLQGLGLLVEGHHANL